MIPISANVYNEKGIIIEASANKAPIDINCTAVLIFPNIK